jgi:plasmid maintenance system killer protein
MQNPYQAGLRFKKLSENKPYLYSVRVNKSYRALGLIKEDTIYWFWIGTHDEYEAIIQSKLSQ